jgi:hypothetical protein
VSKSRLPLLLPIAAVLGAYVYWAGPFTENDPPVAMGAASETSATIKTAQLNPVQNPLAELSADRLSETLERPLFSPTRRPPPPPPQSEPQISEPEPVPQPEPTHAENPVDPNDFSLLAVSGGEGTAVAVVHQLSTDQTFYLHQGDDIEGLEVKSVEARSVTIANGESTFTIAMFKPEVASDATPPQEQEEAPAPEEPAPEEPAPEQKAQ